jgi:hypothetical protein
MPLDASWACVRRRYDGGMAGVVYISEEEAAKDFGAIMRHIRSGDEVRLDCKDGVKAVVKRADDEPVKARSISAILEGLKQREEAQGLAIPDDEFATDLADARARYNGRHNPVPVRRTIAEAIEILRRIEETEGLAVPDPDFASDMEEIHAIYNQPMDMSRWD